MRNTHRENDRGDERVRSGRRDQPVRLVGHESARRPRAIVREFVNREARLEFGAIAIAR